MLSPLFHGLPKYGGRHDYYHFCEGALISRVVILQQSKKIDFTISRLSKPAAGFDAKIPA